MSGYGRSHTQQRHSWRCGHWPERQHRVAPAVNKHDAPALAIGPSRISAAARACDIFESSTQCVCVERVPVECDCDATRGRCLGFVQISTAVQPSRSSRARPTRNRTAMARRRPQPRTCCSAKQNADTSSIGASEHRSERASWAVEIVHLSSIVLSTICHSMNSEESCAVDDASLCTPDIGTPHTIVSHTTSSAAPADRACRQHKY